MVGAGLLELRRGQRIPSSRHVSVLSLPIRAAIGRMREPVTLSPAGLSLLVSAPGCPVARGRRRFPAPAPVRRISGEADPHQEAEASRPPLAVATAAGRA